MGNNQSSYQSGSKRDTDWVPSPDLQRKYTYNPRPAERKYTYSGGIERTNKPQLSQRHQTSAYAHSGRSNPSRPEVDQASNRISRVSHDLPDVPPRRVFTVSEELDKEKKAQGSATRHLRTQNLTTYNKQKPESVHVLREEHIKEKGKNSKFESHSTQSNYVKSTTTVIPHKQGREYRTLDQPITVIPHIDTGVVKVGDSQGAPQGLHLVKGKVEPPEIVKGQIVHEGENRNARPTKAGGRLEIRKPTNDIGGITSAKPQSVQHSRLKKTSAEQNGTPTRPAHSYIINEGPYYRGKVNSDSRYSNIKSSSGVNNNLKSSRSEETLTNGLKHRPSDASSHTLKETKRDLNYNHTPIGMPRSTRSTASRKTTRGNSRSGGHLVECKVRYLGRYIAQELTEDSLSKLRAHIRLLNGIKTKLKLTPEGIRSGKKYGTFFRQRVPLEFVPMQAVYDVFLDSVYQNILLVIARLPNGGYDILAYRMENEYDGRRMEHQYAQLVAFLEAGNVPAPSSPQLLGKANWTLGPTVSSSNYYDYTDGSVRRATSMNDILHKNTVKSHVNWTGDRSRSQSRERGRSRGRSRDRKGAKVEREPSLDRMSIASQMTLESMKMEIDHLTKEVEHLRGMVGSESTREGDGARNREGDGASDHDDVFDTVTLKSNRPPGKLVSMGNNGTVKVRVGDYRKRGHSAGAVLESKSLGVVNTSADDTHDGPIRVVYNGLPSFDASDPGVQYTHRGGRERSISTSTNASHSLYKGSTARERAQYQHAIQHNVPPPPIYATVRGGRPDGHQGSVSSSHHHHAEPVYISAATRQSNSPSRQTSRHPSRQSDPPYVTAGSVRSGGSEQIYHPATVRSRSTEEYLAAAAAARMPHTGPPPHGSRAARARVYRTGPDTTHVTMRRGSGQEGSARAVPFYQAAY